MLQSMALQRVGHNFATEQQQESSSFNKYLLHEIESADFMVLI